MTRPLARAAQAAPSLIRVARAAPSLLAVALAWELAGRAGLVRPIFLPALSRVLAQAGPLWRDGAILEPLGESLFRAFAGLALAVAVGTLAGVAMARRRWLAWLLDPLVALGFPAPKIAFVPIFILWFGIDHLSKILLVAFSCVFPMILAAHHGAASVNPKLIWSAQAMGSNERQILWRVVLPAALPALFSGLRVVLPLALITAFTAEMVAGGGGMGASLMYAQRFFESPTVFAYILAMLGVGFALDQGMLWLRRRFPAWHEESG
jgi:ABC-type nitrate/sulfonate/bicarbonate transport system permease component